MAAPSKLTNEVQNILCKAVAAGLTYEKAAHAAGISYQSLRNWITAGEQAKAGKMLEFFEAIKKARADAIQERLELIKSHSLDSWQAGAWWLERCEPKDYGPPASRVEHTGADGNDMVIRIIKTVGQPNGSDGD